MSPLPVPDGNAMVSPDWYEGYEQGTRDAQQQEIKRARERPASQPPSGDQMTDAEKIEQTYRRGWDDGILVGRASQPPSGDAPDLRAVVEYWLPRLGTVESVRDFRDALRAALAASAPSSPATPGVTVNVTVNDQNVVAIGNEIRVMAPWMSENEVRVWADRIAGVVKP